MTVCTMSGSLLSLSASFGSSSRCVTRNRPTSVDIHQLTLVCLLCLCHVLVSQSLPHLILIVTAKFKRKLRKKLDNSENRRLILLKSLPSSNCRGVYIPTSGGSIITGKVKFDFKRNNFYGRCWRRLPLFFDSIPYNLSSEQKNLKRK